MCLLNRYGDKLHTCRTPRFMIVFCKTLRPRSKTKKSFFIQQYINRYNVKGEFKHHVTMGMKK